MARIEGTGIKAPSKEANKRMAAVYKPTKKDPFDAINTFLENKLKEPGEKYAPGLDPDDPYKFNRGAFFSPDGGAYKDVQVASADLGSLDVGDSFTGQADKNLASAGDSFDESDFQNYLKAAGIRYPKQLPGPMIRGLRDNYRMDKKDGTYRDGQIFNTSDKLLNKAPVEEKSSFIEKTKNLAGSIFNTVTGTQSAAAGEMPSGTQFSPSGDTSFASYRMAGGTQQQQGSGIVTPFSQTSMGKGEPRNVTKFQDTSMGRKPVANLPSDYKQTEAREFAKAAAFQQAKKNPNVKAGVDSKGQPTVTAANDSGRARAQAAAINRKISGKSISQTKAANRASMRASAAARNASFQARKKAGKLSKSERTAKGQRAAKKAAAKKRAQAAAKARNARKKRSRRRGRRGRGR